MDEQLCRRLLSAESELLHAVANGDTAVEHFKNTWSNLQLEIGDCIRRKAIDEATISLAHSTATAVGIVAQSFMALQVQYDSMSQDFNQDLGEIFSRVNIGDSQFFGSSDKTHAQPELEGSNSPCPPFIGPAYKWLLKNLHDPYPSRDVKEQMAKAANTPVENISSWFTNVRRRMGWTALSREYFHNCRAETVDAAYRALVQDDPKRALEPNVAHAFFTIKVTAEGLYSAKFKKSALAGQLDIVVKDMTEEDRLKTQQLKRKAVEEEKKRKDVEKETRRQERAQQREAMKAARSDSKSYPSPVSSPYESLVPVLEASLTDESEEEEDQDPFLPILAGKKRRSSSSSPSTMSIPSSGDERPLKRHRSDRKQLENVANSSISALPSPPSEAGIDHDVFDYWSPEVVELPVTLNALPVPAQLHNRKRRLSSSDAQGTPKRPRGLVGPRLHAVSDPLPKANEFTADFSDWFTANFEMPPAVADEVPDPSTLLDVDVECYNWSSIQECYKLPIDDAAMLASPPYSTQPYNTFNMDPNPFSITNFNPISTGDNLDELYQNIFGTNSHHPPPYSFQPVDGAPSSLTRVTSDSGIASALPSMSFSDDLFSDGGAWSHLPSYTDATGSFDPSSVDSSVPESVHPLNLSSILSEIDLSMLRLPTSSPQVIPCPNEEATRLADKQAKLEQLRVLEEAKRRIEAELAIAA